MNKQSKRSKRKIKYKNDLTAFLFIFPAFFLICFFVIYPFISSIFLSFYDVKVYEENIFVGFKYYEIVFKDKNFWRSLGVAFEYAGILIPVQFGLAFLIALFIKKDRLGSKAVKSTIYVPNMISGIVAGTIFSLILAYDSGLLNKFIGLFGIDPIPFTNDMPMLSILIPGIWLGLGYITLVILAGLNEVPKDYYEAAELDGANSFQMFFHITIPCMKNTLIYLLITSLAANLQQYELSMMITGDLYNGATTTPNYYIYNLLTYQNRRSQAIVASLLMFIILGTLSAIVFSMMKSEKSSD